MAAKKLVIKYWRREIVDLFEKVKAQAQTIQDAESGVFTNGIVSFNIPTKDKPLYPTNETFPFTYKALFKSRT